MTSSSPGEDAGAEAAELLLRRARLALGVALLSIVVFAIGDLLLAPPGGLESAFVSKAAALLLFASFFPVLRWPRVRQKPTPVVMVATIALCATVAYSGAIEGEFVTTRILLITIVLVAGAMFPWGPGPQAATAVIAAALYVANVAYATGEVESLIEYPTIGLAVAFLVSIYVAGEMERNRRELDAAAQTRRDFMAMLSHDIRNPLGVIEGYSEVLLEGGEFEREPLRRIQAAARRALILATNFLEASRFEQHRFGLQRTARPVAELVRHAARYQAVFAEQKHVEIFEDVADDLPPLDVDPHLIDRALANVLNNAIKYAPEGSRIRIAATSCDEGIEILVEDEGEGLSPDMAERLFERYQRGGNRPDSTGLGLYIVRAIVQAHGGRVEARNRRDRSGAQMRLRLPIARDTPPPSGTEL